MLDLAINHKEELQKRLRETWFTEKYKFAHCDVFCEEEKIDEDTWNKHQFVSLDTDGSIIGYIAYNISRAKHSCYGLYICNFSDNKAIFSIDLGNALRDIFERFGFRKLVFSVAVGNPIEKSYDKMMERYGGRVVGIFKEEFRCYDGKYYDKKCYEIFRDDYMKHRRTTRC